MSDQQMAGRLLHMGVDPIPTKISKTTGKVAFAFAKTDKAFQALLEHEEPMVQALVAARLGHKTTLEETRTERLMAIGRVTDKMPVPLRCNGAHTHRFSGDWKINLQNLRRGGELRRAFRAPKGKAVVAVDASQIEARFNATLSGETVLTDWFRLAGMSTPCSLNRSTATRSTKGSIRPNASSARRGAVARLQLSWPVFQNMCRIRATSS